MRSIAISIIFAASLFSSSALACGKDQQKTPLGCIYIIDSAKPPSNFLADTFRSVIAFFQSTWGD